MHPTPTVRILGPASLGLALLAASDGKGGRVRKLDLRQAGATPQQYPQTFEAAADMTLSADGKFILQPDMKAGALYWLPK